MDFSLQATDKNSSARAGLIKTDHGEIQTPIFMPVGTAGAVKAVHFSELENDIKAQIILGNTYHLYLRPGTDVLRQAGGIHGFNTWRKPVLTDSGGFQVFSLGENCKLSEEGALFRSHIDGSKHLFTPEKVMQIEREIGADIIMAFDECTPGKADYSYAKNSMERTHRWLARCFEELKRSKELYGYRQSLFPIVQGCVYDDLRRISAEEISSYNADGNAIGGLAVGEPVEVMYKVVEQVCDILPKDKPRYLMGVGTPANILECIERGVDMFDCVMPTRNARNGMIFTSEGIINIKNAKYRNDFTPLDKNGTCQVDLRFTKAYLRHLFVSDELLCKQILSIHNLGFYLNLVSQAREHIFQGDFKKWKGEMVEKVGRRL